MLFIDYVKQLYSGDLFQGKLLIITSLVLLAWIIVVLRKSNRILKGTVIPVLLIAVIYASFGGAKVYKHQQRLSDITELYEKDKVAAIDKETQRANKEISEYSLVLKFIYPSVMLIGLIALIFIRKEYIRGVALGFMIFSFFAILADLCLRNRLINFLENIKELI
jgi:glucan phosphoethanolaminetransferase (alkaline phosphatase superfamily)